MPWASVSPPIPPQRMVPHLRVPWFRGRAIVCKAHRRLEIDAERTSFPFCLIRLKSTEGKPRKIKQEIKKYPRDKEWLL